MVARQPLATVREARYGYAVANMGSNPHNTPLLTDVSGLYGLLSELYDLLRALRRSVRVLPIGLVRPYPLALKLGSRLAWRIQSI
jgi:hypothetical protein